MCRQDDILSNSLPLDMQLVSAVKLEELDWQSIQIRIPEYCRRMDVNVPSPIDRQWLLERLCEFDLAVVREREVLLTRAGYLLFGIEPQKHIPAARTVLHYGDETEIITGHLWKQLDTIIQELDDLNEPFRLKGTVSDDVFPYSRLALKEVLVNALVHRRYDDPSPIEIRIEPSRITISNPGGLVEEVLKIVGLPIQEKIERGARGIKGYRNPVIADLFYGAGAMDKAGSGLADLQAWVRENEGKVVFGPIANNEVFQVTLYRRTEEVDEVTHTAIPTPAVRYVSNLLEITEMPSTIWRGETRARRIKDIWLATEANSLPAFIIAGGQLLSFSNLLDAANPLSSKSTPPA
jgi:predicted HTH transcriptional regulator